MVWLKSVLSRFIRAPASWAGEKSQYKVGDSESAIYWMSSEKMHAKGRTTVFNTIWMNDHLRDDFPPELVDYIFLHELGHKGPSVVGRVKFIVLSLGSFLLLIALLLTTISIGTVAMQDPSIESSVVFGIILIATISSGEVFRRVKYNEELRAELNVIRTLGKDEFKRRHEKLEQRIERGRIARIRRVLFYPTMNATIAVYEEK